MFLTGLFPLDVARVLLFGLEESDIKRAENQHKVLLRPCLSLPAYFVRVRELEPVAPSLGKVAIPQELESFCPISVGMWLHRPYHVLGVYLHEN